jgi:hypothetical protein
MEIIDHGEWVASEKPDNYPVKLPPGILFARRTSDGLDWYQFQRSELTDTDTVKMLLRKTDQGWAVLTTTYDASELFPQDSRLIEVRGVTDDHESYRMNLVDLDTKQFTLPVPQEERPDMMKMIMEELGLDPAKMKAKFQAAQQAAMKNRRQHG